LVVFVSWLAWSLAALRGVAQAEAERAQIVLVGSAQESRELRLMIAELLERDGVEPEFTLSPRFTPAALLDAADSAGRVHVFVSLSSRTLARLYLRGPSGQRFLLRELPLRDGLDEVGCESIAQVVATSTQALLHSGAGVDRETARADLLEEAEAAPLPPPAVVSVRPAVRKPETAPPSLRFELAGRASGAWTGAALRQRLGGGLELGLSEPLHGSLWLRERLLFEQFAVQHLQASGLAAEVRTSALRLGVDLMRAWAAHSFGAGLLAGVDLLAIAPKKASDPAWSLAKKGVDSVPVLRAELNYEWQFGALYLGLSAYADLALIDSHYEVQDGASVRRVAHPWRVAPGLALRLGFRSPTGARKTR
jgi:hypothetical protein